MRDAVGTVDMSKVLGAGREQAKPRRVGILSLGGAGPVVQSGNKRG